MSSILFYFPGRKIDPDALKVQIGGNCPDAVSKAAEICARQGYGTSARIPPLDDEINPNCDFIR
jgi:hypothetical protein